MQVVTKPEDKAVVYAGGAEVASSGSGTYDVQVFLNNPMGGPSVAIARGGRIKEVKLERHVSIAAILCDVLWTLTIVGVAAPISDGLLGTFEKTDSPVEISFEPDSAAPNPMPSYAVGDVVVPAVSEPVVVPVRFMPATSASPSTSGAPPASSSPPPAPPARPARPNR